MLQISINVAGLSDLLDRFRSFTSEADQLIQQTMLDSANENIVVVAKTLAPKKTGALQSSISAQPNDEPMSILIVADRPYAKFLEYGTRPSFIQAKNAKALRFTISGKDIFAKTVQNPGIPEGKFSFLRPAIEVGMEKVANDIATAIIEELR